MHELHEHFNSLYNAKHATLVSVLLFIGGISIGAFVNIIAGAASLLLKFAYDFNKLRQQRKEMNRKAEEEKIKDRLYQEYLQNQPSEPKNEISKN